MSPIYYEFFYAHSVGEMLLWGVLLVGAWIVLAILFHRKKWQQAWIWINRILLIVTVIFILTRTIFNRTIGAKQEVSPIPFTSFIEAQRVSERYRSVVANILLFVPLGLTAPFSFRLRRPILTTILFAIILSSSIELLQYTFGLGLCEVDDVIFNTLGAAVGSMSFVMWQHILHKEKSK